MALEDGFLQSVLETPEDDTSRLIYADWLDDHGRPERAEFIRVQIELARLPEDDPARDRLEPRERALLEQHGADWRKPLPGWARKEAVFRRGFVEKITARAEQFVKGAKALFAAAPVRQAWLTYRLQRGNTSIPDPALAACPFLGRLTSLRVGGYFGSNPIGDAGVRTLVASPHLAGLKTLDLSANRLTSEGMRAVADSPHLAYLTSLNLSEDSYSEVAPSSCDEGAAALAESPYLAGLHELSLAWNKLGPAGVASLAHSSYLRSLRRLNLAWNSINPEGGLSLAQSPNFANLNSLNVAHTNIDTEAAVALLTSSKLPRLAEVVLWAHGFDRIALGGVFAGPTGARLKRVALWYARPGDNVIPLLAPLRLRSLALPNSGVGPEGARALAGLPLLEGLRELNLGVNQLGDAGVEALAASPRVSSLRVLDLYSNSVGPSGACALAASPHLSRLHVLDLVGNKLGNDGARALAASPHLKQLTRLRLHNNRIVKGVKAELKQHFGNNVEC